MSPGNVCAMARLKGLDLIALTDHNTAGNLAAFQAAADRAGLLFLPGMEICTREEVHLLAYFPGVEEALAVGEALKARLPQSKNRPETFGRQLLVDSGDRVVGEEEALLIAAIDLSLEQACELVRRHSGVPLPAHILRGYGLVRVLGFIPESAGFKTVELAGEGPAPPGLRGLRSSDAHSLGMISEAVHTLDCARNIGAVLAWLNGE